MRLHEVRILVVGDRCWGKAKTLKQAMLNARKAGGPLKKYQVFLCREDVKLDGLGRIEFPRVDPPIEIDSHGFKKGEAKFVEFQSNVYRSTINHVLMHVVSFWVDCGTFEITDELKHDLNQAAERRAKELIQQGFREGELNYVHREEEYDHELRGWWGIT